MAKLRIFHNFTNILIAFFYFPIHFVDHKTSHLCSKKPFFGCFHHYLTTYSAHSMSKSNGTSEERMREAHHDSPYVWFFKTIPFGFQNHTFREPKPYLLNDKTVHITM